MANCQAYNSNVGMQHGRNRKELKCLNSTDTLWEDRQAPRSDTRRVARGGARAEGCCGEEAGWRREELGIDTTSVNWLPVPVIDSHMFITFQVTFAATTTTISTTTAATLC
eukprot:1783220-Amphidinium_carterae.1